MSDAENALLDRYLRGEATPAEQRALFAQALEDQDLFDLLATSGLVQAAVQRSEAPPSSAARPRSMRLFYAAASGLAAAAALALLVLPPWDRGAAPSTPSIRSATAHGPETPGPAPLSEVPHPAFLAARLELPEPRGSAPVFRGSDGERRVARASGTIVAADGETGEAEVDLGAIDGLAAGTVLSLEREPASAGGPVRLPVTAVFRDRTRVAGAGAARAGQRVRLPAGIHLAALSDQMREALATGDMELVRQAASRASAVARTSEPGADVRRRVLAQLGALARGRGDGIGADGYLREALSLADTPPPAAAAERAELLNALATVAAGRGDLPAAETWLRQAEQAASPGSAVAGQVLNNRGAIAALRGDRSGALAAYRSALAALPATDARRRAIVERNLSLVEAKP